MSEYMEFPIKRELIVPARNSVNHYFPIRTRDNEFNWNAVVGLLLESALRKKVVGYTFEQFENDCEAEMKKILDDEDFWPILKEMYFNKKDILTVSPEFLLFGNSLGTESTGDKRIGTMFTNLLEKNRIHTFDSKLNFIEKTILSVLDGKLRDCSAKKVDESPYLPFIAKAYQQDLKFLSTKPVYFLREINKLLSFYAFSYCAQLSLNISDWKDKKAPQPKPLFFILDHEKASGERVHIRNHGYKLFKESSFKLLPYLSMLESIQSTSENKVFPLWEIAKKIEEYDNQNELIESLKKYTNDFEKARLTKHINPLFFEETQTSLDWLGNLFIVASEQFTSLYPDREGPNKKYVAQLEELFASEFSQSRGRSGRVLVLNQDYIILLTNLVVGNNEKLRFHELIAKFQQRGIFVDKQTEQELIKFYERIGNVERMSDSGDAVYVRKTI